MDLLYDFCIAKESLNHSVIGSPPHAVQEGKERKSEVGLFQEVDRNMLILMSVIIL